MTSFSKGKTATLKSLSPHSHILRYWGSVLQELNVRGDEIYPVTVRMTVHFDLSVQSPFISVVSV